MQELTSAQNHTYVLHTVSRLGEVHIRVSEWAPGDHVSADPNGEHRAGWAEFLVQHSLRDVGVQVANVQRSHRIIPRRCVHISVFTKANAKTSSKMLKKKKKCWSTPTAGWENIKPDKTEFTRRPRQISSPPWLSLIFIYRSVYIAIFFCLIIPFAIFFFNVCIS